MVSRALTGLGRAASIVALLAILLAAVPARAADGVTVELSVQPPALALHNPLQLTVTVTGTMRSVPDPTIAGMENFTVIGQSTSSNFSFINGQVSVSKMMHYTMMANREGEFVLGPATVEVGGKRYVSNPVTVRISPSAGGGSAPGAVPGATPAQPAAPAPDPDTAPLSPGSSAPDRSVFIRGAVDQREVYQGEQLTYTFGFYNRLRLAENPDYAQPAFNGFWVEALNQQAQHSNREVGGMLYSVQELRYALFPTTAGEATISEAKLDYYIRNAWDFLGRGQEVSLTTRPIRIKVKPLPEAGRPESFSGAVGRFTVAARLDKAQVKQGEAVTLELTVSGQGNLRTIQEPKLPQLEGFDIYESSSSDEIDRSSAVIRGKKTFKYVIVPRQAGAHHWPGLEFSFFDPREGGYRMVTSEPLTVEVLPDAAGESPVAYRVAPESVVEVGADIRYIKEDSALLEGGRSGLPGGGLFWALHLLPLVSLGGALAWRRHRGRLLSDTGYARLRGLRRKLSQHFKEAARAVSRGDWSAAYGRLERALLGLIGDKLNVETAGMVPDQIEELLAARSVDPELRREVRDCLDYFAFVRFAPGTGADAETTRRYLRRAERLAEQLDRSL